MSSTDPTVAVDPAVVPAGGGDVAVFPSRAAFDAAVADARRAAAAYYAGDGLLVDDATYDTLVARIAATAATHPGWGTGGVTDAVAAGTGSGDVAHSAPMLSLDKAHTVDDVAAWYARLCALTGDVAVPVVVEPKLDGVALAVRYEAGRLHQVVTRGDGTAGEDVTAAVCAGPVVGLPAQLPERVTFEVRGECYMTGDQFIKANRLRTGLEQKAPFVNPRNAVAGSVRAQHRPYAAPLSFAVYAVAGVDAPVGGHAEQLRALTRLGFVTAADLVPTTASADGPGAGGVVASVEEITAALETVAARRPQLGFDIDGAVVKADRGADRDVAGATGTHPRWAVAFKFPAEERTTTVVGIDVTPGRTGALVPRAVLEPVFVAGTTIGFATLHNFDVVAELDVRVGDTVLVKRAGDVIPRVEGVLYAARPEGTVAFTPPVDCPRCGAGIDRSERRWRCSRGRACGAVELLTYAAGRDALDIDGLGDTLLARLVAAGTVCDLADLFTLTAADLTGVDRVGDVAAAKLLAGIADAKTRPLSRLVTALGLRMTGRRISRRLARRFGTLAALRAATVDDLAAVDGVGPVRAATIRAELDDVAELLDRLVAAGVRTDEPDDTPTPAGAAALPFAGKVVVVSGTVPGMSRSEAQEAAERLGAKVSGSVSAKTSLLVAGDGAGSKLAKATGLGVDVMDAAEFAALVAAHHP